MKTTKTTFTIVSALASVILLTSCGEKFPGSNKAGKPFYCRNVDGRLWRL